MALYLLHFPQITQTIKGCSSKSSTNSHEIKTSRALCNEIQYVGPVKCNTLNHFHSI